MRATVAGRLLNIGFIHPDLGLGGAERLVVDAALYLQERGHRVVLFTAHHDRERCFEETRDGTLEVRVCGDFLPVHVGQRVRAPSAIARMIYLACAMGLRGGRFDVIFCDLVSHAIPLLRVFSRAPIVFYCHFPDRLLASGGGRLYRLYRRPIDWLEETGLRMADRVLVNSKFTAAQFHRTFTRLGSVTPEVLYPGVDSVRYATPCGASPQTWEQSEGRQGPDPVRGSAARTGGSCDRAIILSISRYERAKNVSLAIEAMALLRHRLSPAEFASVCLVVAGGYDDRLQENRDTRAQLKALVVERRLEEQVRFMYSLTDADRLSLLSRCFCVVYTPENEHFGFVPLEAMAAARPVVAVNSGGPRETVRHEETGLLCAPNAAAFADALARLIADRASAWQMGQAGREHVAARFSRRAFGARLEAILGEVTT